MIYCRYFEKLKKTSTNKHRWREFNQFIEMKFVAGELAGFANAQANVM